MGCHNGDGNSCVSGQCTCGLCGRKRDDREACSTDDNCYSGNCILKDGLTWGCSGVCYPAVSQNNWEDTKSPQINDQISFPYSKQK